jgi:hypothetical protein
MKTEVTTSADKACAAAAAANALPLFGESRFAHLVRLELADDRLGGLQWKREGDHVVGRRGGGKPEFSSAHEAFARLWEAWFGKRKGGRDEILAALVRVAATAQRAAEDLRLTASRDAA